MSNRSKPAKGPDGRFQPGNNGGGGRPLGSRNKLSEVFLHALCVDFDKHGADVIERVRVEDPAAYLRTVASLTPRKIEMQHSEPGNMSDAELIAIIQGASVPSEV